MAEYISMKQVPGGIVTATDDRILYDYLVNSGIVYGCEISYLGNNMIHINAGYGIIKGGLFEIEDHTEYVDYAESGAVNGQIYIHFDAAADDKIKIVKETSANPHQMIQNEDANFENGIYEIQLCTFRATTTALTLVQQTFVKSVMPIDVLDTLEAIEANTEANKAAGALALKAVNNKVPFRLGKTADGEYGYYKDGADSVTPFSNTIGTLLWKNASPNAGFNGQTVNTPNISQYKSIKIVYKGLTNSTGEFAKLTVIIPNNLIYPQSQGSMSYMTNVDSGDYIWFRNFSIVSGDKVKFQNAVKYRDPNTAANQYCIPLGVYGLNMEIKNA